MSADNGVYILKTGNQYRVKHLIAVENLYWNQEQHRSENKMQPKMILEMFGRDSKYTYNLVKATYIAHSICSRLPICEYGIMLLDAQMTWKQVLEKSTLE